MPPPPRLVFEYRIIFKTYLRIEIYDKKILNFPFLVYYFSVELDPLKRNETINSTNLFHITRCYFSIMCFSYVSMCFYLVSIFSEQINRDCKILTMHLKLIAKLSLNFNQNIGWGQSYSWKNLPTHPHPPTPNQKLFQHYLNCIWLYLMYNQN